MLLKIFVPLGCVVLPVLLPLNRVDGKNTSYKNGTASSGQWNVTGLDQLAWGNVRPDNTDRYWGHFVMALIVIIYVCAVFFDELRGYIRLRQSYMTSPQHRLRASATTVLVTAIPQNWLSVEALDRLYDVFPGGIRNIWINRNFDDLNEKVNQRNGVALKLEAAETDLIIKCKKTQLKRAKKEDKNAKASDRQAKKEKDTRASQLAMASGVSSGNPNQAYTLNEILRGRSSNPETEERQRLNVLNPAIGAATMVGQGVGKLGKTVLAPTKKITGGLDKAGAHRGFVPEDTSAPTGDGAEEAVHGSEQARDDTESVYRTTSRSNEPDTDGPNLSGNENPEPKRPFWKSRVSSHSKVNGNLEPDEYPLTGSDADATRQNDSKANLKDGAAEKRKEGRKTEGQEYPDAYTSDFETEDLGPPAWKKYIREKDRDTMRLPIFGWSWMPSLWLIGKKVDTIDHCRKELARLNLEIEIDQQQPEKFPLMSSAFVQFNHQVAAHMACQSVSHHVPKQMEPRVVEISPDDVIWDNMSIKWWERYLRTFGILTLVCAMVVGWAFPVAFTGLLSQLSYLENAFPWLSWIGKFPEWFLSAIQGILPPLFLAILMAVLPLILRFLSRTQGILTGMSIELTVQNYYFAFLFVQLFLVVAISSSFSTVIENVTDVTSWPEMLAQNIPKSSNYFFSYMILQAMSVSAGALVQIFNLVSWFILAPWLDSTARKKWGRTTNLNQMQWGTFFPVYTTLASIGLIYSVISPLILVFNVITFGLFWFVHRYNTLYVTKFRFDTGGLLFPKGINQLFTGLYVMELCLVGLFFLVRDVDGSVACKGQGICMVVVLVLTALYQYFLNEAFGPLIRYLPITLEDDAVRRDEEFHRAQRVRLGLPEDGFGEADVEGEDPKQTIEMQSLSHPGELHKFHQSSPLSPRSPWASRSPQTARRSSYFGTNAESSVPTLKRLREKAAEDAEAQGPVNQLKMQSLFAGIHDELEDLTPDERDQLVQRAFQHDALRARRPVVWIPRDDLGVSDDEIYRIQRFSKHIWVSNQYQALDGKCRPIFSRSPPDFSEIDLIQL